MTPATPNRGKQHDKVTRIEPPLPNGTLLPCKDGPLNGQMRAATWPLPFITLPSGVYIEDGHKYRRDGKQWLYVGKVMR